MSYHVERSEIIYNGNECIVELCRKLTGIYNGRREESTFFRVRTGIGCCVTSIVPPYAVRRDTAIPLVDMLNKLDIFSSEPAPVLATVTPYA